MIDTPTSPLAQFDTTLAELESHIKTVEQGHLGLQALVESFQNAMQRIKTCQKLLQEAEQQVQIFTEEDSPSSSDDTS